MGNDKALRVMIVDDSLVFRTVLRENLALETDIEVISQAVNGRLAIPRIRHYRPDIVILDMEMPEMDGLQTLQVIRDEFPEVGVVMFSSRSVEGARDAIRALEYGALEFLAKPVNSAPDHISNFVRIRLVPLLRQLGNGSGNLNSSDTLAPVSAHRMAGFYDVCAIGVSTGGPAALRKLLPAISPTFAGSLLIVQHMPPIFTRQLAESLDSICSIKVVEAESGMSVEQGKAYIAPGGRHMEVAHEGVESVIKITNGPPEKNCKPSVNVLFRSVAKVYREKAVGLIMTGMGEDGYLGMLEMKQNGAYLLAQNQESCLIYGMPCKVVEENIVDESMGLSALAARIVYLTGEQ